MKKVTQQDIASALGFSRRTVARALNGDQDIAEDKKKLILDYCEKVGYKKNILSSMLAPSGVKKIHVFLIHSVNNQYFEETKEGIIDAVNRLKHFKVELEIHSCKIDQENTQLSQLEASLKLGDLTGIIIIPINKDKVDTLIKAYQFTNVVTIDNQISEDYSHIGKNYYQSGHISADMLLREHPSGQDLLVIQTPNDKIASHLYYDGFIDHLKSKAINEFHKISLDDLQNVLDKMKDMNLDQIKYIFIPRYADILITHLKEDYPHIRYVVTGINKDIITYLEEDIIVSAINQSYFLHGYLATKALINTIIDSKNITTFFSKNEIITKENLSNLDNDVILASLFNMT
ncbi:substrate-binding domain-containing protein [Acidaminobacter sp. JC074]|uniref:substrate-binding domain-containing protein n=1 Tax=Acidaminobacter sp. JC074 TaxID=2530199 RepID=UPI001F116FE1|nr:substrate-binding domain-containing protein [Acidaminobacter sp. JC074]MCH4887547.1 substrate-binding domain-containing protein [Acidaminobacter sp. JC074]